MDKVQIPAWVKDKLMTSGPDMTYQVSNLIDTMRDLAERANRVPGNLSGMDCPLCMNRGYFTRVSDEGYRYSEECSCMSKRRSLDRIKRSGLSELLERYTFSAWNDSQSWQVGLKAAALSYVDDPSGWFYLAGRPGTGKTHLCTAICGELIENGYEVRYLLWRDFSARAKAVVNDEETYQHLVSPMKTVPVLYIDDLFKTGKGQQPTTGDVNLAFEILNSRYNANFPTIISSELAVKDLLAVDEAVGSRIFERAKNNYADLSDKENWRMKCVLASK